MEFLTISPVYQKPSLQQEDKTGDILHDEIMELFYYRKHVLEMNEYHAFVKKYSKEIPMRYGKKY